MTHKMCSAIHHGFCLTAFGTVNPCCASEPFTNLSVIDNITDHWYSTNTDLEIARTNEWNGEFIPACKHCIAKEEKGIMSRKQKMEIWYPNIDQEFTKQNKHDIIHFDISFGNSCNQMCIMCNSKFSSQWLEADKELVEWAPTYVRTKANTIDKNWALSYKQIDEIVELITEKTKVIEFKGGEPMYDKKFYYFVEKALKKNSNIKFNVCTNASYFNDKSVNFINDIPNINIDVSIDGIGAMYNWIRGYDFEKVDQSFRYFLEHCKVIPMVNYTTMRYNVDRYMQMYNWIGNLQNQYEKQINWHCTQIVQNPKFMSPEYAEKQKLIAAIEQLEIINTNPRNLKLLPFYIDRNNILIDFFKTKCLNKKLTAEDIESVASTDKWMGTIRGYYFDPSM